MKTVALSLCLGLLCGLPARANVSLSALFSTHAALQKAQRVPIWGKASPGEPVAVTLDAAKASTVADSTGQWKVNLDLSQEGPGPFDLIVQGQNTLTIADVVVGEVWVCGGQSNMELPLTKASNAKEVIASSGNPLLRQFQVKEKASASPLGSDSIQGKWTVASPQTSGSFTAAGYFFGKQIQAALNVPVGLLNASWGGTCVEAWISSDGFDSDPPLKAETQRVDDERKAFDTYATLSSEWEKQFSRQDHPKTDPQQYAGLDVGTADWKSVVLPGAFAEAGLPDGGAIWIRRTVTVTPQMAANNIDISLGGMKGYDLVYLDGKIIGTSDLLDANHHYLISSSAHTPAGDHVLAARVFDPGPEAGIDPGSPHFGINGTTLAGPWLAKVEFTLPPLSEAARAAMPRRPPASIEAQNVASYNFNGMIHPILPYAMRGVIWYQGEANWNHGYEYRRAFPLLIKDWRAQWGRGEFPFYFCQIASYNGHPAEPGHAWTPEVREAQTMALAVPNTGEAILIDVGEDANIHPADKQDVGDRLARLALANTYGRKDVVFSGPVYDAMTLDGAQVRLHFRHTEGGLKAKPLPPDYQPNSRDPKKVPLVRGSPGSELEGFAICGEDRRWKWADATIVGDDVLVTSPQIPKPVAVRYAWSNYPYCNLYNGAGLPAGPFRTDDFPLLSEKLHYP